MNSKLASVLFVIASIASTGCTQKIVTDSDANFESVDNSSSALVSTSTVSTSTQTYYVVSQNPASSTGTTKIAQYAANSYVFQNPFDAKQLDVNNTPVVNRCPTCKISTSGVVSLSQSGYVIEIYIDGTDIGSSTTDGNSTFLVNTTLPRHACQNAGLGTAAGSTNAGYEVNYWGRTSALTGGGALAYKVWNGTAWVNAKFKKNIYGKYQWMPATSADPQSYSTATATGLSFCD